MQSPSSSFDTPGAPLDLVVQQVQPLTADISTFRLRAADAGALPAWEAGAHIAVRLEGGLTRAYSLCGDPAEPGHYDIAVKREDTGRGGSLALHRQALPGARLQVLAPRNLFALDHSAGFHLLLGGGIGVTPLLAMASVLARQGKRFHLAVFCRSEAHLPLPADWRQRDWAQATSLHIGDEPAQTGSELARLLASLPADGHVYHCGPAGFMDAVSSCCTALPAERVHSEHFGTTPAVSPAQAKPTDDASGTVELFLARQQRSIALAADENMAEALHRAGVALDTVCEQGICGSCVTRYLEGSPIHNDTCLSADEQREYLAPCCARSASARLVLDL